MMKSAQKFLKSLIFNLMCSEYRHTIKFFFCDLSVKINAIICGYLLEIKICSYFFALEPM